MRLSVQKNQVTLGLAKGTTFHALENYLISTFLSLEMLSSPAADGSTSTSSATKQTNHQTVSPGMSKHLENAVGVICPIFVYTACV